MKLSNSRVSLATLVGLFLGLVAQVQAAGEPVSGNTAMDEVIVIIAAAIVAIGVFSGGGAAIKAGVAIFNKVMKYFGKSV